MKTIATLALSLLAVAASATSQFEPFNEFEQPSTTLNPLSAPKVEVYADDDFESQANIFSYPLPTEPTLAAFRNICKVEQVAGDGSELSQISNMLNWTYQTTSYAPYGSKLYTSADAAHLLEQALLSMGYKARVIYLIKDGDTNTNMRHARAVNAIFSTDLGKWIFADPYTNTMLTNSLGSVLSVEEIINSLNFNEPLKAEAYSPNGTVTAANVNDYLDTLFDHGRVNLRCPIDCQSEDQPLDCKKLAYIELIAPSKNLANAFESGKSNVFYVNQQSLFWSKNLPNS